MTKLIVFDMDGTLYDLNDVVQMSYNMQVEFLSAKKRWPKDDTISFLASNHVYPIIKKDSKSATELFLELGYDKEEWSRFRDAGFDVNAICIARAINECVIRKYSDIAKIVLLSSNAFSLIGKILKHINITTTVFDTIICSDRFPFKAPFKKKLALEYLSKKYNVKYEEMLSIGDRYSTDILPMIELGGKGVLIKQPVFLEKLLDDLSSCGVKTCEQYDYFD